MTQGHLSPPLPRVGQKIHPHVMVTQMLENTPFTPRKTDYFRVTQSYFLLRNPTWRPARPPTKNRHSWLLVQWVTYLGPLWLLYDVYLKVPRWLLGHLTRRVHGRGGEQPSGGGDPAQDHRVSVRRDHWFNFYWILNVFWFRWGQPSSGPFVTYRAPDTIQYFRQLSFCNFLAYWWVAPIPSIILNEYLWNVIKVMICELMKLYL